MIIIIVNKLKYNYFEDYINSIKFNLSQFDIIYYTNVSELKLLKNNTDNTYIFIQILPIFLYNFAKSNNVYLLNTEQAGACSSEINTILHNNFPTHIQLIDYNNGNIDFINAFKPNQSIYYLPYQVNYNEIYNFIKTNDIAFVGALSLKRKKIIDELKKSGLKVDNIIGWNTERDLKLFTYKILINIHYDNHYTMFEDMRCVRCLFNKMIVITENSERFEKHYLNKFIITSSYDNLVNTAKNVIEKYDEFYSKIFSTFDIDLIANYSKQFLNNIL